MRHSLKFSTLILVLRGFSALQFKLFCNEENLHFFNFNTYSRISLYARGHYLRYVEGKHQGHLIAFSKFSKILYCLEKITILPNLWSISFIGNGSLFFITQLWFYAMKEMDWWPCKFKMSSYSLYLICPFNPELVTNSNFRLHGMTAWPI